MLGTVRCAVILVLKVERYMPAQRKRISLMQHRSHEDAEMNILSMPSRMMPANCSHGGSTFPHWMVYVNTEASRLSFSALTWRRCVSCGPAHERSRANLLPRPGVYPH